MSNNYTSKSKVPAGIINIIPEVADDLIRVLDSKLNIIYLNEDAHLNSLGYSWDDLIGNTN